jgi:hypothetical protein
MFSRKTTRHAIVQSNTTVIDPPLRGLEIFVAGTLTVREAGSKTVFELEYPDQAAGGSYPAILIMNIDQVRDSGTDMTDAQLLGFKG